VAGGLSALGARITLNFFLRGVNPNSLVPATVYLRLLTTPSTKTSSGSETVYGSYARLPLIRSTSLFTDPLLTSRSVNFDPFEFATPTSLDDDIVSFDIVNTVSGAFTETYIFGVVQPQRSIIVGKRLIFPSGALIVTA
jgi:hypothetical protein